MKWLAPLLLLSGCATPQPPVMVPVDKIVTVERQVPVPCVKQIPTAPELTTDEQKAALPDGAFVLALRVNEMLLKAYVDELLAVLGACKAPPESKEKPQ